ncbi:MAG: hypothetical protein ABIJ52_14990 [Pseudomonadota bacterium]
MQFVITGDMRRYGHLFQNRYKSILCQEDAYLLELVRYIHLNPLRAKVVPDLKALDRYPYCGNSALMGKVKCDWQNTDKVLSLFSERSGTARRACRRFVNNGIEQGKRADLTGGGLVRSTGGWAAVKALRSAKVFEKADERILGNGDFVQSVLKSADEQMKKKYDLKARGYSLTDVAVRVSYVLGIEQDKIWTAGKNRDICSGTKSFMLLGGQRAWCNDDTACPPAGSIGNRSRESCNKG